MNYSRIKRAFLRAIKQILDAIKPPGGGGGGGHPQAMGA